MNEKEVFEREIPNGIYQLALEHLYQSIEHFTASSFYTKNENKLLVESLCAAFSALYEMAVCGVEDFNDFAEVIRKKTKEELCKLNVIES